MIKQLACILAISSVLLSAVVNAQLYDTPETRRKAAEEAKEAAARAAPERVRSLDAKSVLAEKEAEALKFVGKKYVYAPAARDTTTLFFYERLPPSSYSQDPNLQFSPLVMVSFEVTGIVMPPPTVYAPGKDEYLLRIRMQDGKEGFVNHTGVKGLKKHLYEGASALPAGFVKVAESTESPEAIVAREKAAQERAAAELKLATEKAARDAAAKAKADAKKAADAEQARLNQERAARATREAAANKERADREAQARRPPPRIGMTQEKVLKETSWGAPRDLNRTTRADGVTEQWIYGSGRYLYFKNGVLTTIQE